MSTVPPELDAEALRKKYAAQFEVVEKLQAYAWEHRPQTGTAVQRHRSLIFAIFARATLTYRAVLHLCRGGYTEQAAMLNRSLFEDMAYALWVSLPEHQEESIELLDKHTEFTKLLGRDVIEKHKDCTFSEPISSTALSSPSTSSDRCRSVSPARRGARRAERDRAGEARAAAAGRPDLSASSDETSARSRSHAVAVAWRGSRRPRPDRAPHVRGARSGEAS